jgi:hypothetical protein
MRAESFAMKDTSLTRHPSFGQATRADKADAVLNGKM